MWLSKGCDWLYKQVLSISGVLHSVGVGVLAILMFLTASDVALRYVFNRPIKGAFDITEYGMAIIISLGLAYCAARHGNIKVEVLVSRFTERAQAIFDSVTDFASLVIVIFLTWQSFLYSKIQFDTGVTSTVLLIPKYPFIIITGLGFTCLFLALLADFLSSLYRAVKR